MAADNSTLAASKARRAKAGCRVGHELKIERDLEFANVAGKALTLDLYRPDPASAPTPLIVWIHGAKGGDQTKATTPAAALATPGYAVASIDYRSDPGTPITTGVSDAKAAVRWLRANAGALQY